MILITNTFLKTSEGASDVVLIKDGLYLFVHLSCAGLGTANMRGSWGYTQEEAIGGNQMVLPDVTAADLEGGEGDTAYDRIIDKAEDVAIAYLQSFNPTVTFTKV